MNKVFRLIITLLWTATAVVAVVLGVKYAENPMAVTMIAIIVTPACAVVTLRVLQTQESLSFADIDCRAWYERDADFQLGLRMIPIGVIYLGAGCAGIYYGLGWGEYYLTQPPMQNLRALGAVAGGGFAGWFGLWLAGRGLNLVFESS